MTGVLMKHIMYSFYSAVAVLIFITTFCIPPTSAEEGQWLVNKFPTGAVKKNYHFMPTQDWLEKVQLASVKLGGGCSGSFVSSQGLVMTNHHCAHECIEQLSTSTKNFIKDGFYASKLEEEKKCPEIEISRLVEIQDISTKVLTALKGKVGKDFQSAKKAIFAQLEGDCSQGNAEETRCNVVTLYKGGSYHLYKYERFQDVRLVFAPEFKIAFFGGDPDNFMFPRYDLDLSLLRVYKNNKPLENKNYFPWSKEKIKEGDLTFVSGNPGRTNRLSTVSELEFLRSVRIPDSLMYNSEQRGFITEYQKRNENAAMSTHDILFSIENSLKVNRGKLQALNSSKLMKAKQNEEAKLRKMNAEPFVAIEKAYARYMDFYKPWRYLEMGDGYSKLLRYTKIILRSGAELEKPNDQRFHEFSEAGLPEIKMELYSEAKIFDETEIFFLRNYFIKLREVLSPDHPLIRKLFKDISPENLASKLVKSSSLKDIKKRETLFGHKNLIAQSKDPFFAVVALMDEYARVARDQYESEVESVLLSSSEKIAQLRNKLFGTNTYPDATGTFRITYGTIQGYKENGNMINPITMIEGAFDRATGYDPFELPTSWLKAKSQLNLKTSFNLVTTNDIIGGNSGSPLINQKAEVIGLVFDGNIQSIGGDYYFDPEVNRAVSVAGEGIIEALKSVYKTDRIIKELNM